jgi:polyribonucleotide nucleotidyltransferase
MNQNSDNKKSRGTKKILYKNPLKLDTTNKNCSDSGDNKEDFTQNCKYVKDFQYSNNIVQFKIQSLEFQIQFENICKYSSINAILSVKNKEIYSDLEPGKGQSKFLLVMNSNTGDNFFYVNYKETPYSNFQNLKKEKFNDREVLVSRIIDKIFRPILGDCKYSINILALEYCQSIDSIFSISNGISICLKKLLNISVSIFRGFWNEKYAPIINKASENMTFTLAYNKEEIYTLDLETVPRDINDIYRGTLKCIDLCEDFINEIQSIKCVLGEEYSKKNSEEIFKNLEKIQKKVKLSINDFMDYMDSSNDHLINGKKIDHKIYREFVSAQLVKNNTRIKDSNDNIRTLEEIRTIQILNNITNSNYSTLFMRGNTSILGVVYLDSENTNINKNNINLLINKNFNNLVSFYNFYNFCVSGQGARQNSRRELGHADLIRSAFQKVINKNTYLKLYSEVLSSDGSSSMASVCALSSTLNKMGILKENMAGISIGIFRNKNKENLIIDMTAKEDQYSEVDFKITGCKNSITAIRMDAKSYLSLKSFKKTLQLSIKGINSILDIMNESKEKSKEEILYLNVNSKHLGLLIGPSGSNIKELCEKTQAKIRVHQNGQVVVNFNDQSKLAIIEGILNFYNKSDFEEKEKIAFFAKEDFNDKEIVYFNGVLKLSSKKSGKKGNLIFANIKNWKEKTIQILEIL